MRNILLLGAGRSSSALIQYLLEHASEDGYHLTVNDLSAELATEKTGNHSSSTAVSFDIHNDILRVEALKKCDLVISLLPPSLHIVVAHDCVSLGRHLITASYITNEISALHSESVKKKILLLNECGLDPGIDHMSAVEIINRLKKEGAEITSFKSYTGGLIAPEYIDNPWGYKFTWNPRNVILAGQGTAKYIQNGKYHYIPYHRLFTQLEKISIEGYGRYEGYANRDSLAYRKQYGISDIPTLIRGTLRGQNFCSAWNVFVQIGLTDDTYVIEDSEHLTYAQLVESMLTDNNTSQPLANRIAFLCQLPINSAEISMIQSTGILDNTVIGLVKVTPAQILQHLLESKWQLKENDHDMIIMHHLFEYRINNKLKKLSSSLIVKGENQKITAMAKTVGYPLGIVGRLLLKGKINLTGVVIPVLPEIYIPVLEELKKLKIEFVERDL